MKYPEYERGPMWTGHADAPKEIVPVPQVQRPKVVAPMNFEASRWAHTVPVLRPIHKAVLLVLARHADRHGCSWCSQKTLAAESGCCDRSVRSVLKGFEERGLIRRIGRMGAHGGQLTDVVVLAEWPGRCLIPETGHPLLGRYVKETEQTRFQWTQARAQMRAEIPPDAAGAPDQNKSILISTITTQNDKLLEQCFEALGPWATVENMQFLIDDFAMLLNWLKQGLHLQRDILPVLAKKSKSEGEIPLIRTWKYFEKAVRNAAGKRLSSAGIAASRQLSKPHSAAPCSASMGSKDDQDEIRMGADFSKGPTDPEQPTKMPRCLSVDVNIGDAGLNTAEEGWS